MQEEVPAEAQGVVEQHKQDQDRNELLAWACARGLIGDVQELVRHGGAAGRPDKKGCTPLHYAASHGHTAVAEFLSTKGVDMDCEDPCGRTALHYAAAGGHSSTVSLLASKSVWLDSYDAQDDTPLHLAARCGHAGAIRALSDVGAKLELCNKRGLTPLGEALTGDDAGAATALLEAGACVDAGVGGFSLLHLCAGLGATASLELLLASGSGVSEPLLDASSVGGNAEGITPLHAAAAGGQADAVRILLDAGADASTADAHGRLPSQLVPPGSDGDDGDFTREDSAALVKLLTTAQSKKKASGKDLFGRMGLTRGAGAADAPPTAPPPAAADPAAPSAVSGGGGGGGGFGDLGRVEQLRKVDAYLRMDESSLRSLPNVADPARKALAEARKASQLQECMASVAALRKDGDFQRDAVDASVRVAIEEIKRSNNVAQFKGHSALQSVMAKMNKLQAVLRANGNPKVSLEDLIATPSGPSSIAESDTRVASLGAALARMKEEARVALGGAPLPPQQQQQQAQQAGAAEQGARAGGAGAADQGAAAAAGTVGGAPAPGHDGGAAGAQPPPLLRHRRVSVSSEIEEVPMTAAERARAARLGGAGGGGGGGSGGGDGVVVGGGPERGDVGVEEPSARNSLWTMLTRSLISKLPLLLVLLVMWLTGSLPYQARSRTDHVASQAAYDAAQAHGAAGTGMEGMEGMGEEL
ncbi:hypothetical protein FOA52_003260 [Chlamydomonas sp. UWO 241]|nr:hypothetical protein FOA52_003260 [Chlamydomonas sp. UWO 241]